MVRLHLEGVRTRCGTGACIDDDARRDVSLKHATLQRCEARRGRGNLWEWVDLRPSPVCLRADSEKSTSRPGRIPIRCCPCETGRCVFFGIRRRSLLRRERGCRTCQRARRQRGRNRAGWHGRGRSHGAGGCSGGCSSGSSSGRRVRERRRRRLQLTLADQRAIPVVPSRKSCATSASRWPSMARWRRRRSGCSSGPTELRSATMVAGAVKGSFYYLYRYTARGEGVRHQAEHAAGQAVPAHAEEGPDQRSGANCREKICFLSPHCPPPLGKPEAPELREGSEVLMNRRVDSALRSGELTRKWGNSRPERVDTPMGQPSPGAS